MRGRSPRVRIPPRNRRSQPEPVLLHGGYMLDFLLNNSITIIFLITASFLGYSEYRRYLQKSGQSPEEFRLSFRKRFNELGNELLLKLLASALITAVISMVSFRELWMNDAFHIVFLTNLLYARTVGMLKRLTLK